MWKDSWLWKKLEFGKQKDHPEKISHCFWLRGALEE